jgi:predicted Zn-dependent protease
MPDPLPKKSTVPEKETRAPFRETWPKKVIRALHFDPREQWWRLLDFLEARRGLRRLILFSVAAILAVAAGAIWAYPRWTQRNAIKIARQWIDAGKLDHAAATLKQAFADSPQNPTVWQLAAEVARRQRNPSGALDLSRQAAALAPGNADLILEWSEDALLAGKFEEAEKALAQLPAAISADSARAQRVAGEIARRNRKLTAARDHFERALHLDGPLAIDEVPLGSILINSRDLAERQRGLAFLQKWAADREWGATALRTLLADAMARNERAMIVPWAEALRVHPGRTVGDMKNCLAAFSRVDEMRFKSLVAELEKTHGNSADNIALLVGWLNQIDRAPVAAAWIRELPDAMTKRAPVVAIAAESFRQAAAWDALDRWVTSADWGRDLEFVRLAYGLEVATKLGQPQRADNFWQTLQSDAQTNGVHAVFAADTIYPWGRRSEAVALWWLAAEQPGVAIEALGNLVRHYQTQRDAEGQYQVFRRLHSLRTADAEIANNLAFFSALTERDVVLAEKMARENFERAGANLTYRATYAFVLCIRDHASDALALLQPVAHEAKNSAAVAFAYGLALANTGKKTEARTILDALDPAAQTTREVALIKAALD